MPLTRTYPSLTAFYTEDARRRASPEWDFGTGWMTHAGAPRWRVSWIPATGEVYAACTRPIAEPVELLAVVRDADELTRRLDGWGEVCGQPDSLDWVRRRLVSFQDCCR
jgi:hypothetical protein